MHPETALRSILVVRRDNIGDLVCTTPLLSALRRQYPEAWLGALVNSYNAPVLAGNPDLDAVIDYTKLKHLERGESAFRVLRRRVRSLWELRGRRLDLVALATPDFSARTLRLARWLKPGRIAGFSDGSASARRIDVPVPVSGLEPLHEVERVYRLAQAVGVRGPVPPLRIVPSDAEMRKVNAALAAIRRQGPVLAVHISARRPAQRWPGANFASLISMLAERHGATTLLLWSPGKASHAQHPGDDERASEITGRLDAKAAVHPYRTERLEELIGALAVADAVVCSDGGAMHVAAALGKPITCFFGDSPVQRWRPWGVKHRILRPESRDVRDVSVDLAAAAVGEILAEERG